MNKWVEHFKQFRSHRLFLVCVLPLALLPSLFLFASFLLKMDHLAELEQRIEILTMKYENLKSKKEDEEIFLKKLRGADHYYIDKYVESQVFLEPELKRYQAVLAYDADDIWTKRRVQFLQEGNNQLRFSEQNLKTAKGFVEVDEVQQKPVEMNLNDLKRLLASIEDVQIGPFQPNSTAPQLMIKNFELAKRTLKEQEEVYLVNLHLIKREISQ